MATLWLSQTEHQPPPAASEWYAEAVLVWRQGWQLRTWELDAPTVDLLEALATGACLQSLASASNPDALMARFVSLLSWGVLCDASAAQHTD